MQYPGPTQTVRVRNIGSTPFVGKYDGATFRIVPGSEGFVPFAASCLWFGHPAAMDLDDRNRHRTAEVERLRVRYGVYEADKVKDVPGIKDVAGHPDLGNTADAFLTLTPDVEVFTVDGDRIITVIEDPDGNHVTPELITSATHQRDQLTIEEMRGRMAEMERMMEGLMRGEAAIADGGEVEGDVPPAPPVATSTETTKVGQAGQAGSTRGTSGTSGTGVGTTTGRGRPKPPAGVVEDTPTKVAVSQ